MEDDPDYKSDYQRTLSWAIIGNTRAIYSALHDHTVGCLARELAEFLLQEAGWDLDKFEAYAELVAFDEL